MMALGTAELQVMSRTPTLFMMQFSNKGRGVVTEVPAEEVRLYVPAGFRIYKAEYYEKGSEKGISNPICGFYIPIDDTEDEITSFLDCYNTIYW